VSATSRDAGGDYSKGFLASRADFLRATALRTLFAVAGLAGVVLLVAATLSTVIAVKVVTVQKASYSGYDRHGLALVLIAGFALLMLGGALRGARPAMLAVAVAGIAALLIAIVGDLPDVHKTGEVGQLYEGARASPHAGYYLETLGGALLLLTGGGLLLFAGRGSERDTGRAGEPPVDVEPGTDYQR
jgi:hypothetical protein